MMLDPIFLTVEDVLRLHRRQQQIFGGDAGLRDLGLLEAAVGMPQATFAAGSTCTTACRRWRRRMSFT